jgi:signal transduction histidine kinase
MEDLDKLWLQTLHEIVGRAAHEVKDALNGVSLNLEVVRSRSASEQAELLSFATAASEQLEILSARTESLLFLTRPHREASGPADVALTLKHLATLLVPAIKSDGGALEVDGSQGAAPTAAPAQAVRLALAAGILTLTREGGTSRCRLESGSNTVVRFSHESAGACTLEPPIAAVLAGHTIRIERSGKDLVMVFPGS